MKFSDLFRGWILILTILVIIAGIGVILTILVFRIPDSFRWLLPTQSNTMPEMGVAVYTAFLAFATLVLALFSFLSIRRNDENERRERKKELINEIITWTTDLGNVSFGRQTLPLTKDAFTLLGEKYFKYQDLDMKTLYLKQIAKTFNKELELKMQSLSETLSETLKNIETCNVNLKEFDSRPYDKWDEVSGYKELNASEHLIRDLTKKLIELCAKGKIELG